MDLAEFNSVDKTSIRRHPWELARLQILKFLLKKYNQPKTIVDIGSGDAYLATSIALASPHCQVVAIDINYDNAVLRDLNKNRPSNIGYFNDLETAQYFLDTTCDAIILMDILEHVAHPEKLFNEITQKLSLTSDTWFIITVPAFQFLFSEHDKKLRHYRRYNRKQLLHLLQSQGLVIQTSGYCFHSLLIPRLFQLAGERLGSKKATIQNGIHNWKGNKFFTAVIKNLFWTEFKLSWFLARMNIHLPGLTCYSICQNSRSSFHATMKNKD
jgi:hypothetical protein